MRQYIGGFIGQELFNEITFPQDNKNDKIHTNALQIKKVWTKGLKKIKTFDPLKKKEVALASIKIAQYSE